MFQFHYGSIKIKPDQFCRLLRGRFQFHYGSIKIAVVSGTANNGKTFQFHYGSIKIEDTDDTKIEKSCFNSTMVRLKFLILLLFVRLLLFQFHYGSIKILY